MTHSPIPWKVSNYRPNCIIQRDSSESTYDKGDDKYKTIVYVERADNDASNAAFIVKAANNYERMKERIKALSSTGLRTQSYHDDVKFQEEVNKGIDLTKELEDEQ